MGLIWWPPDLHHARRIVKDGAVWYEAAFDGSREGDWIPCGIAYSLLREALLRDGQVLISGDL